MHSLNLIMIKKQKTLLILVFSVFVFGCFYIWRDSIFDIRLKSAEDAYSGGENDEALAGLLFAGALEENGDDEMRVHMAKVLLENGGLEAARSELVKLTGVYGKNAEAYALMGKIEMMEGNYSQADGYYAKACSLSSGQKIFLERCKNLVRSGNFSDALKLLDNEGSRYDQKMISYYRKLIKFIEAGDCAEILSLASALSGVDGRLAEESCHSLQEEKDADLRYVRVQKADFFNKIQEPDFAFAVLQKTIAENPHYRDALITLGKTYLIGNEYGKAAETMEKCTGLDSNSREAFFWLAGIYEKLGDKEKAAEYRERYEYLIK